MGSDLLNIVVAYRSVFEENKCDGYQEIKAKEQSAEEIVDFIRQRIASTVFQNFNGTEVTILMIEKALANADVQASESYLKILISELRKFHETLHYYVDGKRSDGLYKSFFWQASKDKSIALEEKTQRLILQACDYQIKLPKKSNSITYQAADTNFDKTAGQGSEFRFER